LCRRIAGSSAGTLYYETPAANNCRLGGIQRSGLFDLLSLMKKALKTNQSWIKHRSVDFSSACSKQ
jgi:hypothetical protein